MRNKLLSNFLDGHFLNVENNIKHGHYIDTDFIHYSELVSSLINLTIKENGNDSLFFTALCLPPFQWFNFKADPSVKRARLVSEVKKMESDYIWVRYLKYINSLAQQGINVYRYVFCVEKNFDDRRYFKDLVENEVIEAQFRKFIIMHKDKSKALDPLEKKDIEIILSQNKLKNIYKCYDDIEKNAYLIVDENNLIFDDSVFDIHPIEEIFTTFQRTGHHETWVYTKAKHSRSIGGQLPTLNRPLPEDFFLIGKGSNIDNAEWHLALTADVTSDFKKVRLWFTSDGLQASERESDGDYKYLFDFENIKDFIRLIREE